MLRIGLLLSLSAMLLTSCSRDESSAALPPLSVDDWIENEFQKNLERYATDPNMLIERGLVADRKHQYVDLLAVATGAGSASAVDTFLAAKGNTGAASAIAVTELKPIAIQRALEFIGMSAGYPLDGASRRHWPKGERVTATFFWGDSATGRFDRSVQAEKLITDLRWNAPLPAQGFRFVGSSSTEPVEIMTAYNATNTVLEVPYLARMDTITGALSANPDYQFTAGERLRIRLRPESIIGRVLEFAMDVRAGVGPAAEQLQNLRVTLVTHTGEAIIDGNFESVFLHLQDLISDGKEPYLQLSYADSLSAISVQRVARFVRTFLIAQDIRFEPDDAHLFYSAFLPRESWRNPSRRRGASQPVEIHLKAGTAAGELIGEVKQFPQSNGNTSAPSEYSFGNSQELEKVIEQGQPWQTDGVFLFVDPNVRYAQIRQIHELTRMFFPNIYVFM